MTGKASQASIGLPLCVEFSPDFNGNGNRKYTFCEYEVPELRTGSALSLALPGDIQ